MRKNQLLVIILILLSGNSYSQRIDKTLNAALPGVIEKTYPACVRMWGYDTVSHQQMSATFSGVVVTPEGHMLTVAHTTLPGKTYKVTFPDGKEAIAVALGKINFPATPTLPDVAMMKILGHGKWPSAALGWSYSLKAGEPCFSIAYPESLNQPFPTLRFGCITEVMNSNGFIRSSCLMEPGDSGGPLFDYLGRVIGLRSAIGISEADNYEVPVDLYRKYWTALNETRHYEQYPGLEDSLPADPLAASLQALPSLKDLTAVMKATTNEGNCLKVISSIGGRQQTIHAALFSVSGRSVIVSKSSCVGEQPIVLFGRKSLQATVIARDKEHDLVLLQLPARLKQGITIGRDSAATYVAGRFLLSPQPDTAAIRSILGSHLFALPKMNNAGFLGAAIAPENVPLLLKFVMPNSPAAVSGLQTGDEMISINGVVLGKPEDYGRELFRYWPGDSLLFEVRRADSTYKTNIVLGVRPQPQANHPAILFNGGRSERRDGFGAIFVHDAILRPEQCGGPVFDTDGRFLGLNIARFSRTSSLAIPTSVIQQFIAAHLPSQGG
jgi:serine protease Do